MACLVTPVAFCVGCCSSACDVRNRQRFHREPLFRVKEGRLALAAAAAAFIGLALYIYMSIKCAERHRMPYSPWPTSYEKGPCFSEGEGAYVGTGFFSACLMGAGSGVLFILLVEYASRRSDEGATGIGNQIEGAASPWSFHSGAGPEGSHQIHHHGEALPPAANVGYGAHGAASTSTMNPLAAPAPVKV